jgi:peptidyl-prolyl cis-trans isomerase SurA
MIRTGERDDASAKNLIFEIHDQLQGGVSWEETCNKFSDDASTKGAGGRLRPFGVGAMAPIPEFERVAFSLQKPGEISDPFQTQYGWHVVRLEKKIPVASFEQLAPTLKGKVTRDDRVQISKASLMKKLKTDFSFTENASAKTKVFALADTTLTKGKWKINLASVEKETLFTLQSKNISAGEFLKFVKQNQKPNGQTPEKYIDQLYSTFVEQSIHAQFESKIIKENPDFELLLKEYYEGILLFDIMEKEVWKKASDDSIGQRKYYESNKQKYTAGERVHAIIYSSTSTDIAKNLKGLLEKNDSTGIQKILRAKNARHEIGTFQKTDRPALAKIDWKPGLYMVENGGVHYLVQVKKMVPPGIMTFEEARTPVISDYQDYLEKTWLSKLKKKNPVKVNAKAKNYVLEKLQS